MTKGLCRRDKNKRICVAANNWVVVYILVVFLSLLLASVFIVRKSDFHIDEMFSYSLANSDYGLYYPVTGIWNTREDNLESFLITEETAYNFSLVYTNQENDVHPPLYYLGLHMFSLAAYYMGIGFTKWTGLAINLFCMVANFILLYKICRAIWDKPGFIIASAVAYGFSYATIHYMVFTRMYVMMGTAILLLLYVHILLMKRMAYSWKYFLAVFVCTVTAVMVQYYSIIYLFFICVVFGIYALFKKRIKLLFVWAASVLLGLACSVLIFPAMLDHLFLSGRGTQAQENLIKTQASTLFSRLKILSLETLGYIGVVFIAVCLIMLCFKFFRRFIFAQAVFLPGILLLLASAIGFSLLIIWIMPYTTLRYLCAAFAPLSISFAFALSTISLYCLQAKKYPGKVVLPAVAIVLLASLLVSYTSTNDDLLMVHNREKTQRLAQSPETPFVVVLESGWHQPALFTPIQQFDRYFALLGFDENQVAKLVEEEIVSQYEECYLYIGNAFAETEEYFFVLMQEKTGAENVEFLFDAPYGKIYYIY